jgi:translation initiation factor 1 (eIF-1/SUI1)
VASYPQAPDQCGTAGKSSPAALGFSHLITCNQVLGFDDDDDSTAGTVLGRKIVVSVQSGKHKVTKVEGIPAKHSPGELLKKMKAKSVFSCGGHVAKDKDSGRELLVLQGNFSAAVAAFLVQEGVADSDSVVCRG